MSVALQSVLRLDGCCRLLARATREGDSSPKKTLPGSWHALMLCEKYNKYVEFRCCNILACAFPVVKCAEQQILQHALSRDVTALHTCLV